MPDKSKGTTTNRILIKNGSPGREMQQRSKLSSRARDEQTFDKSRNLEKSNASKLRLIEIAEKFAQNIPKNFSRTEHFSAQKNHTINILLKVIIPAVSILSAMKILVYLWTFSTHKNTSQLADFTRITGNMGLGMVTSMGYLMEQLARDKDMSKPFGKCLTLIDHLLKFLTL